MKRVVVIGHGMVGHRFVEALTARDAAIQVTVLSEESRLDADRVDLRLGVAATAIDRDRQVVATSDGDEVAYDELVLATGSSAFVPPLEGRFADGCFVYRTLADLDAIKAAAQAASSRSGTGASGVVIGGGLLGLEAANALRLLGLKPHVVETAPHLMAVQLDETGRAAGVELRDGTVIDAGLVVFAAGVRPRDQLAREAGLETGPRGGVVVDGSCRSVDDDRIHVVGEAACIDSRVFGLVAPGYAMAETVADRLVGGILAGDQPR